MLNEQITEYNALYKLYIEKMTALYNANLRFMSQPSIRNLKRLRNILRGMIGITRDLRKLSRNVYEEYRLNEAEYKEILKNQKKNPVGRPKKGDIRLPKTKKANGRPRSGSYDFHTLK